MIPFKDIDKLINICLKLLSDTDYLRRYEATKDAYKYTLDVLKHLRKLFIATTLENKKVICVSGKQGAGKTTLMRNFYHLDGEFLSPTLARGERVPVLITEKEDIKIPKMIAKKIEKDDAGNYSPKNIEISADEYKKLSNGTDENVMYLELYMPFRHTCNESVSFMLLPGFEDKKSNEYWNNLIEFSVNSSDAAVFVFNETSFSDAYNESILDEIKNKFGKNLVFAISGSDGSFDDNAEVKQTCLKELEIPASESDRVVCVGSYADEAKNAAWIDNFKNSIEKYVMTSSQRQKNNSEYIVNELCEIKNILYKILDIVKSDNDEEINNVTNSRLIKTFEKEVKKQRKTLEGNLHSELDNAKNKSKDKLEKRNIKKSIIKKRFFGANVKDIIESRKRVEESLYTEDQQFLPEVCLKEALNSSLNALDHPTQKNDRARCLPFEKGEKGEINAATAEKTISALAEDVANLLSDDNQNGRMYLNTVDHKKLMEAVVKLSSYYYFFESYNGVAKEIGCRDYNPAQPQIKQEDVINSATSKDAVSKNNYDNLNDNSAEYESDSVNCDSDSLSEYSSDFESDSRKIDFEKLNKIGVGFTGVMGYIDWADDGKINNISKIVDLVKSKPAIFRAVTGMATGVAGVAAGVAALVKVADITKDINRMEREDYYTALDSLNAIYYNVESGILDSYDYCMEKIKERIEDNLAELDGNRKKTGILYNAKVGIDKALDLLDKITNEANRNAYGIESFIAQ